MKIGYAAGWNSADQHTIHLAALQAAGAASIFEDRSLPRRRLTAPGLSDALANVTTGDVLILPSLLPFADRPDILALIARHLRRVAAHLLVLEAAIDTSKVTSDSALSNIEAMAYLASEIQTQQIPKPSRARRKRPRGKQPALQPHQVDLACRELEAGRGTMTSIAKMFGVSYRTLWRAIRRREADNQPANACN